MTAVDKWLGAWAGPNTLYYEGKELLSDGTAEVRATGQGRFVTLTYTWAYEGAPQEGVIVFPAAVGEQPLRAALFDSWHTGGDLMVFQVLEPVEGVTRLKGSYGTPPEEWGWRIELSQPQAGTLLMRHFNITPDGQEEIAVRADYGRG